MKERYDVIASSLSSYFGVGFNTVQEQLDIDLGLMAKEFDEAAQDRMDLGNAMENGCLDYFEKKLGVIIDERNSEYKYACDGMLKCKRDGRTFIEGVETGVENKYSNSSMGSFVDDIGYHLQCQGYMMAWGLNQWLLCGMWQGKPQMKLLKANKEMQDDIEQVVTAVVEILMGMRDISEYPWEIVEKYSSQKQLKELTDADLEQYDKELLQNLGVLKQRIKELEDKAKELETYAKTHYDDSKYEDNMFKYTISTSAGRKSFDKHTFSIENPTIDIEKYYVEGTPYKTVRITAKKN